MCKYSIKKVIQKYIRNQLNKGMETDQLTIKEYENLWFKFSKKEKIKYII